MCKYIQPTLQWNVGKGEPLRSISDLLLHNRDDFNASPQIYKYKNKYNASFAQHKKFILIWTKNILASKWQNLLFWWLFFFFFSNLSNSRGTGEQRKGIALCFILITASDGLWIPQPMTRWKSMQLPNVHPGRNQRRGERALPWAKASG